VASGSVADDLESNLDMLARGKSTCRESERDSADGWKGRAGTSFKVVELEPNRR
jgi:hypothetical protein